MLENEMATLPEETVVENKTPETPKEAVQTEQDILSELYNVAKQDDVGAQDQPVTQEYTEAEKEAMSMGWRPKDQYTGNKKYRDADEFLEFHHLRKGYSNLDKQNKELKTAVEQLGKFLITKEQTELTTTLQQVALKKVEAVKMGDIQAYQALEEQEKLLNKQIREIPAPIPQDTGAAKNAHDVIASDPELMDWVNKNPWIKKTDANDLATEVVRNFAAEKEREFRAKNPNCKHIDAFRYAEMSTKTRYPEYKGFQQQQRTNSVEPARNYSQGSIPNRKITINDLGQDERIAVRKMCSISKMTEQDYIDALIKSGAIKHVR